MADHAVSTIGDKYVLGAVTGEHKGFWNGTLRKPS